MLMQSEHLLLTQAVFLPQHWALLRHEFPLRLHPLRQYPLGGKDEAEDGFWDGLGPLGFELPEFE